MLRRTALFLCVWASLGVAGACRTGADDATSASGRVAPDTQAAPPVSGAGASAGAAVHRESAARARIVVLGDSLTAGLGVDPSQAFPARLQARLDESAAPFEIVNAGVSGDTSAGGLRRFDWATDGDVRILVVALGGNDGLRGLPVEALERNLSAIVERAQERGIAVLLCGMEAPPNFGESYTVAFRRTFRSVAERHHVALLPFLLEGVAGVAALNQADGIHPNPEGAERVAAHVWTALEPLLGAASRS